MNKKTARLSIADFLPGESMDFRHVIATHGSFFPASFTYNQPNMLDGVAFCLCMAGGARIRINSREYEVGPGSVITILPNHIVEPLGRTDDLELRMLVFSLDMVDEIRVQIEAVRYIGMNPCIQVGQQDGEVLLKMHELIYQLYRNSPVQHGNAVARGMLGVLVLQLEALYGAAALAADQRTFSSRAEELTEQFLKLLVGGYKEHRAPAYYAGKLCVTPKYLSQSVRHVTGETVYAWINKIVIVGAKNLLRTSGHSVLQVSEELNFPNPSFFGRFFKQHTGVTPLEYKKGEG